MTAEGITRVKRRGAVVLDNNTVYDDSISYTALGVLAVLLARPDDAPKGYRTLKRPNAGVGQASILSAFRELREAGYRYQFLRRGKNDQGKAAVYTDTYIYETPVSLEMAKRDHFDATGHVAIDVPDRRKPKEKPAPAADETAEGGARLPDAQKPDAQTSGAQSGCAQNSGEALEMFSGSPKPVEQINQGAGDEKTQDQELPSQPAAATGDDATKADAVESDEISPARLRIREMVAGAREKRLRSSAIKEVASLRHDQEQVPA